MSPAPEIIRYLGSLSKIYQRVKKWNYIKCWKLFLTNWAIHMVMRWSEELSDGVLFVIFGEIQFFKNSFFEKKSYFWSKWFNICANFVLPGVLVLLTSSDLQLFKFKISKLIQIPVMAHLDSWVNGRIPVGPRPARQQFLLEHTCILTFGTFSKSGSFFNHSAHFSSIMS